MATNREIFFLAVWIAFLQVVPNLASTTRQSWIQTQTPRTLQTFQRRELLDCKFSVMAFR